MNNPNQPVIGPHGVNLSEPRGSTKFRQNGPFARAKAELEQKVAADRAAERAERAKRKTNAERASGAGKAGQ